MTALLLLLWCPSLNAHAARAVMEGTAASNNSIYIATVSASVGIGTTTPTATLFVAGNSTTTGSASAASFSGTGGVFATVVGAPGSSAGTTQLKITDNVNATMRLALRNAQFPNWQLGSAADSWLAVGAKASDSGAFTPIGTFDNTNNRLILGSGGYATSNNGNTIGELTIQDNSKSLYELHISSTDGTFMVGVDNTGRLIVGARGIQFNDGTVQTSSASYVQVSTYGWLSSDYRTSNTYGVALAGSTLTWTSGGKRVALKLSGGFLQAPNANLSCGICLDGSCAIGPYTSSAPMLYFDNAENSASGGSAYIMAETTYTVTAGSHKIYLTCNSTAANGIRCDTSPCFLKAEDIP